MNSNSCEYIIIKLVNKLTYLVQQGTSVVELAAVLCSQSKAAVRRNLSAGFHTTVTNTYVHGVRKCKSSSVVPTA